MIFAIFMYFFTVWLSFTDLPVEVEVEPVSLRLFRKKSKTLMGPNVLLFKVYNAEKLFSMKYSYLVLSKITPDVNNYLWSLHVVQSLGDSLHVRHNL